jgi:Fe/S biogenesis protein NfuA
MLVAIEDGTAVLQFAGGCQGCGMINVTLKEGVEKMLTESVPEITAVRDVTDHAAGANPYQR